MLRTKYSCPFSSSHAVMLPSIRHGYHRPLNSVLHPQSRVATVHQLLDDLLRDDGWHGILIQETVVGFVQVSQSHWQRSISIIGRSDIVEGESTSF